MNFKNPTDDIPANGVPQSKEHEFLFRQVMRKSQHVSDKKERTVNALHERTTAFHTCILSRTGHFRTWFPSPCSPDMIQVNYKAQRHCSTDKVMNGPSPCLVKLSLLCNIGVCCTECESRSAALHKSGLITNPAVRRDSSLFVREINTSHHCLPHTPRASSSS